MNDNNSVNLNENEWFVNSEDNSSAQMNTYACPNCGKNIEQLEIERCPHCNFNFTVGGVIDVATGENVNYGTVRAAFEKVKSSELVQSIKEDFKNSKSIELVKSYFKGTADRRKQKKQEKENKKTEIKAMKQQIKEMKKQK